MGVAVLRLALLYADGAGKPELLQELMQLGCEGRSGIG